MNTAFISIDLINDIASRSGKLAAKGYAAFAERRGTFAKIARAFDSARSAGAKVIHVRIGFSRGYLELPTRSPLLSGAQNFGVLALNEHGTDFIEVAKPNEGELLLVKHRISAFSGTALHFLLTGWQIERVVLVGVATDLAVMAAAFDAHDLNFEVTILEDCCIAASDADHEGALAILKKIGKVSTLDGFKF